MRDGSKEKPYELRFTFDPKANANVWDQGTVFEEFFHAGQEQYYGKDFFEKQSALMSEVEAKVAKAVSGAVGDIQYEKDFANNPAVIAFSEKVRNNEPIDINLMNQFYEAVNQFAYKVYEVYSPTWGVYAVPSLYPNNQPQNYDARFSLDYFMEVVAPKVEVDVNSDNNNQTNQD